MELNDGSQYRIVTDPPSHIRERELFCFRAASARNGVEKYVDTAFAWHREQLANMRALCMYQFVWETAGTPEEQAEFLVTALGGKLRPNEMIMVDPEAASKLVDPVDFVRRWCTWAEEKLNTRAWVYVSNALAGQLTRDVTGDRIVMAPRYSGSAARGTPPTWSHDIHQYTEQGYFPGCGLPGHGDTSYTTLTVEQIIRRSRRTLVADSQNGYSACNRSLLHNPKVPGTDIDFPGGLRRGPAGDMLLWVAEQLHRRVENGGTGYGMWGYACRDVRAGQIDENGAEAAMLDEGVGGVEPTGDPHEYDHDPGELGPNSICSLIEQEGVDESDAISNHASGTAIDWHAPRHPLGKRNTYSATQRAEIHDIEAETEGCVRWGGDWTRPDDMHWEVMKSEAECARVLAKLRKPPPPPPGSTRVLRLTDPLMFGEDVKVVQRVLKAWYGLPDGFVDGYYGNDTIVQVKRAQRGTPPSPVLDDDGVVGPDTRRKLGIS